MSADNKGQKVPVTDPKLKMAATEIKAILDKYDIAGTATMLTPTHMEFVVKLDPSWSVVTLNAVHQLQIHPPLEVPGLEVERKERIAKTVNMLFNLRNQLGKVCLTLMVAEGQVREHFGVKVPPKPQAPVIPGGFNRPKNGGQ
jgi:hypothetical protein